MILNRIEYKAVEPLVTFKTFFPTFHLWPYNIKKPEVRSKVLLLLVAKIVGTKTSSVYH